MTTKKFTPIQQLLSESWDTTKIVALPLIRLGLITVGLELGLILILALIGGGLGFTTHAFDIFMKGAPINPSTIMRAGTFGGAFFLIWILLAAFIATMAQVAGYKIIEKSDSTASAWQTMMENKSLVITLWGAGLFIAALVIGNLFLFIIPGIIVAVLFTFTVLGIVLNGYGIQQSMRRSVTLVSTNFMDLSLRWLVIIGISALISLIFSRTGHRAGTDGIVGLLSMIVNIGFTIFSLVYTVFIYKHAESVTPKDKQSPFTWIIVLAIIGWIFAATMGRGIYSYMSTDSGKRFLNKQLRQQDPMMDPNQYMNSRY